MSPSSVGARLAALTLVALGLVSSCSQRNDSELPTKACEATRDLPCVVTPTQPYFAVLVLSAIDDEGRLNLPCGAGDTHLTYSVSDLDGEWSVTDNLPALTLEAELQNEPSVKLPVLLQAVIDSDGLADAQNGIHSELFPFNFEVACRTPR